MSVNKRNIAIAAIAATAAVALAVEVSVKFNLYTKIGSLEFAAKKTGLMSKKQA